MSHLSLLRSFLSSFIAPLPLFFLGAAIALFLYKRGKTRAARILLIAALMGLYMASSGFLPNLMCNHLENKYPSFSIERLAGNEKPVHILVLGAGHTNDDRFPATDQLTEVALTRLAEGIRLHRMIPGSRLVTSGYGGREKIPQAEVMAEAAGLLGTDQKSIYTLVHPTNTQSEASEYKRLFGDTARLILVTSAMHLPRAMHLFQHAGLDPIPAPTNHLYKKGKLPERWRWVPSAGNLRKTESALHEYVGMIAAWAESPDP